MSVFLVDQKKVDTIYRSVEGIVDEDGGEVFDQEIDHTNGMVWISANMPLIDLYKSSLQMFIDIISVADELHIVSSDEFDGLEVKIGIKCCSDDSYYGGDNDA